MDTKDKIVIGIVLAGVVSVLFISKCGKSPNDHLDKALQNLDSAQHHLDSALAQLDSARFRLDSMRQDFVTFSNQLSFMREDVKQLNQRSITNEQIFKSSLKELKTKNQKVLEQLKVRRDTLPEIKIY